MQAAALGARNSLRCQQCLATGTGVISLIDSNIVSTMPANDRFGGDCTGALGNCGIFTTDLQVQVGLRRFLDTQNICTSRGDARGVVASYRWHLHEIDCHVVLDYVRHTIVTLEETSTRCSASPSNPPPD